jgi:hypothetical protein
MSQHKPEDRLPLDALTTSSTVRLDSLVKSPYQQPPFSEPIRNKLAELCAVFHEVDSRPLAEWEDNFRRDLYPLREIAWEVMARAYRHFTEGQALSREQKRDIFATILRCSTLCKAAALKQPVPVTLSRKKAREIAEFLYAAWGDDPAAHLMIGSRVAPEGQGDKP